jgi:small subunit ribosomal protein S4
MALIAEAQSLAERDVPTLDEVPNPVKMEPNLVVEFYSR